MSREKTERLRDWMRQCIYDAIRNDSRTEDVYVGFITAREKLVFKVISISRTQWFDVPPVPFSKRDVTKELIESIFSEREVLSSEWKDQLCHFVFRVK